MLASVVIGFFLPSSAAVWSMGRNKGMPRLSAWPMSPRAKETLSSSIRDFPTAMPLALRKV